MAGVPGSSGLEALLVFGGVVVLWVTLFGMLAPRLEEMKVRAIEAELHAECMKIVNTVDTLATYGAGSIYLSLTPYFRQSMERGIYFCKNDTSCRCPNTGCSRRVWAVKYIGGTEEGGEGGIEHAVYCESHVAEWVDIIIEPREEYWCGRVPETGNFTVEYGAYYQRPEAGAGPIRRCWK